MVNLSHSHPEDRASVFGLARHLIDRLSSALAKRRVIHTRESTLEALQLVEPGLLDQHGIPAGRRQGPMEALANSNPAVIAAGVFCLPRR
jgi:hypothetical protein